MGQSKPSEVSLKSINDNKLDGNNDMSTPSSSSYYPLFAQFGRNRFHFNPVAPRRGVKIHYDYNSNKRFRGFPEVSSRSFDESFTGNYDTLFYLLIIFFEHNVYLPKTK